MGSSETEVENPSIQLSRAIYKVQCRLLELPLCTEEQLLAAGSLLPKPDYDDVVTERSLSSRCGYPRCPNPIPPSHLRKGRFRIARPYQCIFDAKDADRFCSNSCCISNHAVASTLHRNSRTAGPTPSRIAHILALFHDQDPSRSPPSHSFSDLGLSKLTIHEKTDAHTKGEVSADTWLGPSDAIEGYVPKRSASIDDKSLQFKSEIIVDDGMLDANGKRGPCTVTREVSSETKAIQGDDSMGEAVKLKSALKKPGMGGGKRSVKWAEGARAKVANANHAKKILSPTRVRDEETASRLESAEACASALIKASEAVASGESGVEDAVNEAGLVILPPLHDDNGENKNEVESDSDDESLAFERIPLKWPKKAVPIGAGMFDALDSWHDPPPEGFSLSLSTFATIWKALFEWMTCSSVAYIYGKTEESKDEFLYVNEGEYPPKVTLSDGRSLEIKTTLAGCISRALPQVVAELRLPTPISTIEKTMGELLETMSFMEALPPWKTKEWKVIVLLFLDALSVTRIASLSLHMANKEVLINKVIEAAGIGRDEYEIMKELMIPLGRLPQFSVEVLDR